MDKPPSLSSTELKISPKILSSTVNGEEVLLDLAQELYYGMNPTATSVWQSLKQGLPLKEIVRSLSDEYDVTPKQVQEDVLSLIEELRAKGLLT